MRCRAPALAVASLLACAVTPAAALAAGGDYLRPYEATVDSTSGGHAGRPGLRPAGGGYDPQDATIEQVGIVATAKQATGLEADGIGVSEIAPEKRPSPRTRRSATARTRTSTCIAPTARGRHRRRDARHRGRESGRDEARADRHVDARQADPRDQDDRRRRSVPDGTRPALLFSPSTTRASGCAAEEGRRLRVWFAQHKNEPQIKALLQKEELWFEPIMNVDGYDFTFTCGTGTARHGCDYRTETPNNRFWRKTLRDNNANGVFGDSQDGVDPNRNYPAKRGIDEEGASNVVQRRDLPRPYALSEPENLAFDRLLRRVKFVGNINYHTDGQLLLTPVSQHDRLRAAGRDDLQRDHGTDGDSAVFPYQPQRSSDLYESNGDTIDNEYLNYGMIGWTPEMDTCATGGDANDCRQFSYPDQEDKINGGVPEEPVLRRSTSRLDHPHRPPVELGQRSQRLPGQADLDIQPKKFDVSYGNPQTIEAIVRKSLASPTSVRVGGADHRDPDDGRPRGRALRRGDGRVLRAPSRGRAGRASATTTSWPATSCRSRCWPAASSSGSATASRRSRPTRPRSACWSSRPRTTRARRRTYARLRHRAALPAAARRRAHRRRL